MSPFLHTARAHKKVTTVKLLNEDIQKLKNEIASNDKTPTGGNCFSRCIRRLRRKKLDHLSVSLPMALRCHLLYTVCG